MSTLIAGNDGGVSVTRYARGVDVSSLGSAYQVTWHRRDGVISSLSFEDKTTAMAFYHMVYLSFEIR